jgi:hypothetical protein
MNRLVPRLKGWDTSTTTLERALGGITLGRVNRMEP